MAWFHHRYVRTRFITVFEYELNVHRTRIANTIPIDDGPDAGDNSFVRIPTAPKKGMERLIQGRSPIAIKSPVSNRSESQQSTNASKQHPVKRELFPREEFEAPQAPRQLKRKGKTTQLSGEKRPKNSQNGEMSQPGASPPADGPLLE